MSATYTYLDAFKDYRESQKKYDYFFLGVILASLSLSVQMIDLPSSNPLRALALLSWGLFFLSFLSGMFRQERLLRFYRIEADKIKYSTRKEQFVLGLAGQAIIESAPNVVWTAAEMTDQVAKLDYAIDLAKKYLGRDQQVTSYSYAIQKWCYVAAMVGLIIIKFCDL